MQPSHLRPQPRETARAGQNSLLASITLPSPARLPTRMEGSLLSPPASAPQCLHGGLPSRGKGERCAWTHPGVKRRSAAVATETPSPLRERQTVPGGAPAPGPCPFAGVSAALSKVKPPSSACSVTGIQGPGLLASGQDDLKSLLRSGAPMGSAETLGGA